MKENRRWTPEEAGAFKEEVASIARSKIADMDAANESGNNIMGYDSNNNDTTTCQDGS